jgi:hypothetical protein
VAVFVLLSGDDELLRSEKITGTMNCPQNSGDDKLRSGSEKITGTMNSIRITFNKFLSTT